MAASADPLNRIHVNNLAWSIKEEELKKEFAKFGKIVTAKIPTRPKGGSKGFGFITFESEDAAKKAVEKMNNQLILDRRIGVVFSTSTEKKKEKPAEGGAQESNRLEVRQLAWAVTVEDLESAFQEYGPIASRRVVKARNGKSRGFGFVVFENVEDAKKAKEEMDGKEILDRPIQVQFLKPRKKKVAREKKEKEKGETTPTKKKRTGKKGKNKQNKKQEGEKADEDSAPKRSKKLWVKISKEATKEELESVFSKYGVTKIDIPTRDNGPKGHAFLTFETEDDAEEALEATKDQMHRDVCFKTSIKKERNNRKRGKPRKKNVKKETN